VMIPWRLGNILLNCLISNKLDLGLVFSLAADHDQPPNFFLATFISLNKFAGQRKQPVVFLLLCNGTN
jgi:hypothetical protein